TGEPIAGAVVVEVADGSRCEYVVLRATWRTHGKGTVAKGRHGSLTLHEGPIPSGVTRFPFRFEAPDGPFTYRGHLLNVDHYLEARIEIPWAVDPSIEEDFVLVPGAVPAPPPDPDAADGPGLESTADPRIPAVIGAILLLVGTVTFPFPGFLILVAAGVFLFAGLRQKAAASRVGDVIAMVEPRVVSPGDEVQVAVALFPPKDVAVNGVTATLRGAEVCVSGSGTDKKTHRHVAHRDKRILIEGGTLPGGVERVLETSFTIPALGMWSFAAHRHRVLWDVRVEVDIPSWPDWGSSMPLVVWPKRGSVEAARSAPRIAAPKPTPVAEPEPPETPVDEERADDAVATPVVEAAPPPEPAEVAERAAAPRPNPTPDPTPDPTPAPSDAPRLDAFTAAVESVLAAGVVSGDRREKAAALVGRAVSCWVRVERVQRPFGRSLPRGYEGGRVIRGTLVGSSAEVEIVVPAADAEAADALKRGDEWAVEGVVAEWARLPDRPVVRAAARGS
ncbi:MAG: hypothetical protein RLN75_05850, partial [Longimicrobiales bacterium]